MCYACECVFYVGVGEAVQSLLSEEMMVTEDKLWWMSHLISNLRPCGVSVGTGLFWRLSIGVNSRGIQPKRTLPPSRSFLSEYLLQKVSISFMNICVLAYIWLAG